MSDIQSTSMPCGLEETRFTTLTEEPLEDLEISEATDKVAEITIKAKCNGRPAPQRRFSQMSIEESPSKEKTTNDVYSSSETGDPSARSSTDDVMSSVFDIAPDEQLLGKFSCSLLRLVALQGQLYITNRHICFWSQLPEGSYQTGNLKKKNHRTSIRWHRYHFILKNQALTWYKDQDDNYVAGTLDLKKVTHVRISRTQKHGVHISAIGKSHLIVADSEISQNEWLNALRKEVFIAKNSGTTIRLALPISKISDISKESVFEFAEYIRIRINNEDGLGDGTDDYNFAFFADLSSAYHTLLQAHKEHSQDLGHSSSEASISSLLSNEKEDIQEKDFLPLSTVSAILCGSVPFDQEMDDVDNEDNENENENENEKKNPNDKQAPISIAVQTSLKDDELDKDGDPLSFTNIVISPSDAPVKSPVSIGPSSPTSLSSLSVNLAPDKVGRPRSRSVNSLRSFPSLLHRDHRERSADDAQSISGHLGSIGSILRKSGGTLLSTISLTEKSSETPQPTPSRKNSLWISRKFQSAFQKEHGVGIWSTMPLDANLGKDETEEEETEDEMNEQLMRQFPMLDKDESVQAAFSVSLWRLIPYYGRLYITQQYFCFYSRVLTKYQRLVVPISEVEEIERLKSKGYYLVHGIRIQVKNMDQDIYFEFASQDTRNKCYASFLCQQEKIATGSDQKRRRDKLSEELSKILQEQEDHVILPKDGPPVILPRGSIDVHEQKTIPASMHITCLTIGSRGDVQPYIALCKELQNDGHQCRIASHGEYKEWIESHGIEFRSIGGDPGELMKLCVDNSFFSISFIRNGVKFFYQWFETLLETAWDACQGTEVLIESPSAMVGIHIAERLEIPYFRSMPFPWTRTARFPHPFALQNPAQTRVYNDMTYIMIDMALWAGTSKYINRFRKNTLELAETTLDGLEIYQVPHIYSFSPSVIPPPIDWPDYVHCTGYWFLDNPDQSWTPDDALLNFLHAKDDRPILYIGFGSITVPDPDKMTSVIVNAVLKAHARAIICKGWSSRMTAAKVDDGSNKTLDNHPGTILHLNSVPHDWLFPQIHGVVHHGGAGTTAAGLRAGLPTVIKPFFGDQRFWGQRVEELGAGVCIPKLERLYDALVMITTNKSMIEKAKSVGETIRSEHGTRRAIDCIYRDLSHARRRKRSRPMTRASSENRSILLPSWRTSLYLRSEDHHSSGEED